MAPYSQNTRGGTWWTGLLSKLLSTAALGMDDALKLGAAEKLRITELSKLLSV